MMTVCRAPESSSAGAVKSVRSFPDLFLQHLCATPCSNRLLNMADGYGSGFSTVFVFFRGQRMGEGAEKCRSKYCWGTMP